MDKPISKITSIDFQQEVDEMATRLSSKTISDRYSLIKRSIEFEGIKTVYDVSIKASKKTDIEIPTKQEILSLLESIKDTEIEVPVYLAALCGLRRSEVAALKWQDINFKKSLMRIHDAIVPNDKNEFVSRDNTKSYAGTRTIQVFDSVLNVLKKHTQPSGYVTNLNPNQIYKRYAKALKKSKIKHYKFHSLRHYCISVMLLLNIPKNYIADYVGHESESLIEKIYGHIMLEEKPAFFNRVDEFYNQMQNEMQNEKTQTQV
jgi:integrase